MRKVQLLLVCLVLSVAASAADKVVKLPNERLDLGTFSDVLILMNFHSLLMFLRGICQ